MFIFTTSHSQNFLSSFLNLYPPRHICILLSSHPPKLWHPLYPHCFIKFSNFIYITSNSYFVYITSYSYFLALAPFNFFLNLAHFIWPSPTRPFSVSLPLKESHSPSRPLSLSTLLSLCLPKNHTPPPDLSLCQHFCLSPSPSPSLSSSHHLTLSSSLSLNLLHSPTLHCPCLFSLSCSRSRHLPTSCPLVLLLWHLLYPPHSVTLTLSKITNSPSLSLNVLHPPFRPHHLAAPPSPLLSFTLAISSSRPSVVEL